MVEEFKSWVIISGISDWYVDKNCKDDEKFGVKVNDDSLYEGFWNIGCRWWYFFCKMGCDIEVWEILVEVVYIDDESDIILLFGDIDGVCEEFFGCCVVVGYGEEGNKDNEDGYVVEDEKDGRYFW